MHPINTSFFAEKFITYATGGTKEFKGKPGFSEKVKELIRKASELKTGCTLFQKLLDLGKPITIVEGKYDDLLNANKLDLTSSTISLNFDQKIYYVSLNEEGERELFEAPPVSTLIHESTHLKHMITDVQAMVKRVQTASTVKDMHNQEEEITITGHITGSDEEEPCNDNATLIELGLPPKIDHNIFSQKSPLEAFQEMIVSRAIGSLRKKLAAPEGRKEAAAMADTLLPLVLQEMSNSKSSSELAEYRAIMNLFIRSGCKSNEALEASLSFEQQEYETIARELLKVGCKSDKALESAVFLLKNANNIEVKRRYLEIIYDLLASECKSTTALETIIDQINDESNQLIRRECLTIAHTLLAFDCKSKKALENSIKQASKEINSTKQSEWFAIIHELIHPEYTSPTVLSEIQILILNNKDPIRQMRWTHLFTPLISKALDNYANNLQQWTCKNIMELINADYSAVALDLFKAGTQHCSHPEPFKRLARESEEPIKIIHKLIETVDCLPDLEKSVQELSQRMHAVERIIFLQSLKEGLIYISILGISMIKQSDPDTQMLHPFAQMEKSLEKIKRSSLEETVENPLKERHATLMQLAAFMHRHNINLYIHI